MYRFATGVAALLIAFGLSCTAVADDFTVDSLQDTLSSVDATPGDGNCATAGGDCTLRAAIQEANALTGTDTVEFSVTGTINIGSDGMAGHLPAINERLRIIGPGPTDPLEVPANSPPQVILDGSNLADLADSDGLRFLSTAGDSNVWHLAIVNFPSDGIVVNAQYFQLWGSFIGVMPDGTAAGNGEDGLYITGDNAAIGISLTIGIFPPNGEPNVISANAGRGIVVAATGPHIYGNYIGPSPDGTQDRGNGGHGIRLFGNDAFIGGSDDSHAPSANLISGNSGDGIYLEGNMNAVYHARIGIGRTGGSMGNGGVGVRVIGHDNRVGADVYIGGGTDDPHLGTGNIIANNAHGVVLGTDTVASNNNEVAFNDIGIVGSSQGNAGHGVLVRNGEFNVINHNQILNNGADGVHLGNTAEDSFVQHNEIGVANAGAGPSDHGNDGDGVYASGQDHYIGGNIEEIGNVIGFNAQSGVNIAGGSGHSIVANRIGVAESGDDIGNTASGIVLQASAGDDNQIGLEEGPNIIGYNATGITIRSDFNSVEYNYVGTDTSCVDHGNLGSGVRVEQDAVENRLIANTAAYNGADGVTITDNSDRNRVLKASMFDNTGQGIDLGGDGFTPNDPDDPDDGPNRLMNRPELNVLGYDMSTAHLMVETSADIAMGNATYPLRIDYYWYDRDMSNQGRYFITSIMYNSPGSPVTHDLFLPAGTTGGTLRATVTDDNGGGSTSELSDEHMFGVFDIIHEGGFEDGEC